MPIVTVAVDFDLLALGYVKSLARPGGKVTGLNLQQFDLAKKRVELLTRLCQASTRRPYSGTPHPRTNGGRQAAPQQHLDCSSLASSCATSPMITKRRSPRHRLITAALLFFQSRGIFPRPPAARGLRVRHKIASVFASREWVDAGGLFSYGVNLRAMFRRAAELIDTIVKGAKAADLPIEQPTKFELVLNLKTAEAIGVTISPAILVRADEVIE